MPPTDRWGGWAYSDLPVGQRQRRYVDPRNGNLLELPASPSDWHLRIITDPVELQGSRAEGETPVLVHSSVLDLPKYERGVAIERARSEQYESSPRESAPRRGLGRLLP